jgi:hypothetical protein
MFANAADEGRVGLTEGCYFLRYVGAAPINWSELMWFFHADLLLKEGLRGCSPEPAPPLPEQLRVARSAGQAVLRWKPVPGASAYRVYRAEKMGGPWTWLNSPYVEKPAPPLTAPTFTDREGKESDAYFVTAVDEKRRESRWFPEEPLPHRGGAAPAR